jgi:DNA-binding response OmpR family regulator
MNQTQPPPTPEDQEADQALRDARSRFVAGFTQRLSALGVLLDSIERGSDAALAPLQQAAHKLAGLGGVLGFPTVSDHAAVLEQTLLQPTVDMPEVRAALTRMGAGFAHDLSGRAPSWATDATRAGQPARILLVEDDQEQRRTAAAGLRAAGYRVVTAESGLEAVDTARLDPPDLILLDVDLPDLDGMAVCRRLKLEPALSSVPVIFCTARAGLMDRMAGLTLGADDYITKPYVPAELLIRIKRLVSRPAPAPPAPALVGGLLPYDLFATTARAALAKGPASLLLVRVAAAALEGLGARCNEDLRRRDILGRVDDTHLVLLAPDLSPSAGRAAMQAIIDRAPAITGTAIGVADASSVPAGTDALDAMLAQADLSVAAERVAQSGGQTGRVTVLLSEDDPDVLHIIDARLRAAGYRTVLALDGQQTLDVLARETPAVVLLDLMMPKLTGFDVLMKLRERAGARPRVIVVSARGRDEDVTRAFELGADDYVTKPFNPEELMARIARLVR